MRLIDADKLKEEVKEFGSDFEKLLGVIGGCTINSIQYIISQVPTIKVEPVRHGHWFEGGGTLMPMHREDEYTNPKSVFFATCSECHITINCGAKMDGGFEDENHR